MNGEDLKYPNLPKIISPLDYEGKAYNKELPPILVLNEGIRAYHSPVLRIIAVGENSEKIAQKFDQLMQTKSSRESWIFNQEPLQKKGVTNMSGWEFMGTTSTTENSSSFEMAKEMSNVLQIPVYYRDSERDKNLHLIDSSISESSQLQDLIK